MKLSSLIGHVTEIYASVTGTPVPADRVLDQFFRSRSYLGSKDRRFISETLYGMLRYRLRLESFLTDLPASNDVRTLCAAYLLLQQQAHVQVLSEELSIPTDVLTAIEVRCKQEEPAPADIPQFSLYHSFPQWMVERWNKQYGNSSLSGLCRSLNTQAPMTLRVNTIKITREECRARLRDEGVESTETPLSPFGLQLRKRINLFQLQAFRSGLIEVQDEGSQLLALLVDPKPGSKVVDACAGAGGKSLAMAAIMKNRGEIFALDVHSTRMEDLRRRVKRSGADTIRARVITEGERIPSLEGAMHHVLVDAPCSGTGTIRRNPGMKWSVTPQTVSELQQKQIAILGLNAQYVRPGGRLIYATCSLMEEENQQVAQQFLETHPEFELGDPSATLGRYGLAHLANNGYFQLTPGTYDTDGFFAAVFTKRTGQV